MSPGLCGVQAHSGGHVWSSLGDEQDQATKRCRRAASGQSQEPT